MGFTKGRNMQIKYTKKAWFMLCPIYLDESEEYLIERNAKLTYWLDIQFTVVEKFANCISYIFDVLKIKTYFEINPVFLKKHLENPMWIDGSSGELND